MKRCLIAAALVALLAPAGAAKANTYDVYSCWAGFGTFRNPNASSAAWTKDQTHAGGHFIAADDCATNTSSGSMSLQSVSGPAASQGQYAELSFTAPTGTSVLGANIWRSAWSYGSGSGPASQRSYVTMIGDSSLLTTDADAGSDVALGTRGSLSAGNHGIVSSNFTGVAPSRHPVKLALRVGCGFADGCPTVSASSPAPNHIAAGIQVFGTKVTVQDDRGPSIDVADSGLLSEGTASGVQPVLVTRAFDESGVKKMGVYADYDSEPIAVVDYEPDVNWCIWTLPSPCLNAIDREIPVDTRALSNGDHSIVVKAFDAAGNETTSSTHYMTVKNDPPAAPPPSDPGTGGGDPGTGGGGNPGGGGLPNGVPTDGGSPPAPVAQNPPTLKVTFDRNGRSMLKAQYGRMVTVRGRLRDGSGGAIANAQVDYSVLSAKAGARVQNLGSVRTGSDGVFVFAVATKLGSRQLRFAYSPQLGGPVAATAQARLDVVAPITLRVGPGFVDNKHAVTFRGRLLAGPMPRKGKLVNLQVVVDGHWHTFATVRSYKSGKFKYRYRFMRTYGRVAYRFRALSRFEAAYPFVAGHSKTATVRVNWCPCE